jgi:hypothetical protein
MEIKDLEVSVECMEGVRGGYNSASNQSYNGGVFNLVGISAQNLNGSGVSISNGVFQENVTSQTAGVVDVSERSSSLSLDHSQLFSGYGRGFRAKFL